MIEKEDPQVAVIKKVFRNVVLGILVIVLIVAVFDCFYTVPSGQEGVLLTFGKADMAAIQPGLHFKLPFVQSVVKFDIRTQKYGISALQNGDSQGNPATGGSLESASSSDLQIVSLQLVVNYHLTPGMTPVIWSKIGPGYEDTVIQPSVHEATKAAVAQFTAADLVDKREEVRAQIEDLLKQKLAQYNIVVEQVSIVNLDFSAQFNQAIESKVTAQQLKEKADNDLQRIIVEANQVRTAAEGQRDAAIDLATGEAKRVQLVQQQLSQSPQYVEYIKAKAWNGVLPNFYMAGGSNSPNLLMQVPIVNPSPSVQILNATNG